MLRGADCNELQGTLKAASIGEGAVAHKMQQRHRLLTSGSIQRALPNRLQKHTILSAWRPSGIAAAYPKVVAVFISNDKQRPEGLSVLERHGRGGMKLREASNSCDKGVAQHVHAQ